MSQMVHGWGLESSVLTPSSLSEVRCSGSLVGTPFETPALSASIPSIDRGQPETLILTAPALFRG